MNKSPRTLTISGAPSSLLIDELTAQLVAAAMAAGDESELAVVPSADHYAPITVGTPAWAACRTAVERLLKL